MAEIKVSIALPEELLHISRLSRQEIGEALKQTFVLELVRQGELPFGKAAELLGMSKAEFLMLCGAHQISIFQFTEEELEAELKPL